MFPSLMHANISSGLGTEIPKAGSCRMKADRLLATQGHQLAALMS